MRRSTDNHNYWCEIVPPEADGRWSWLVQLDDVIVREGTARWRWLARWRANDAAEFAYMEELRLKVKRRRRSGTRWQPNL